TDTTNHCDDCTTNINLPFSYQLYDQTFNTANVDSDGTVQFVSNLSTFTNTCLPGTGYSYAIFAYWDDLCTGACGASTCTGCGIFTSTSGSAPNRIFNIEYRANYYSTNTALGFEVRLYEGQTKFDVVYGTMPSGNTSATGGVQ